MLWSRFLRDTVRDGVAYKAFVYGVASRLITTTPSYDVSKRHRDLSTTRKAKRRQLFRKHSLGDLRRRVTRASRHKSIHVESNIT